MEDCVCVLMRGLVMEKKEASFLSFYNGFSWSFSSLRDAKGGEKKENNERMLGDTILIE